MFLSNEILNILTIVLIVAVAIPVIWSRIKDSTIKDLRDALEGCRARADEAVAEAHDATVHAEALKADVEKWKAKYEEQSKYVGAEAFMHFEALMTDHSNRVAERHSLMLQQMESMDRARAVAVESIGALIIHNGAILAAIAGKLNVHAPDTGPPVR